MEPCIQELPSQLKILGDFSEGAMFCRNLYHTVQKKTLAVKNFGKWTLLQIW